MIESVINCNIVLSARNSREENIHNITGLLRNLAQMNNTEVSGCLPMAQLFFCGLCCSFTDPIRQCICTTIKNWVIITTVIDHSHQAKRWPNDKQTEDSVICFSLKSLKQVADIHYSYPNSMCHHWQLQFVSPPWPDPFAELWVDIFACSQAWEAS